MNNIFPTGGMDLGFSGQLPSYGGGDPLQEVLSLYSDMVGKRNAQFADDTPSGGGNLRKIASNVAQQPQLKFGGIVGQQSNPGADIMARSSRDANSIYEGYKKPQITAGDLLGEAGIKENDQFPGFKQSVESLDVDKQLDREGKRTNIDATKQRIEQGNRRLNIAEEKAANPNLKFMPVKGGNIIAFDQKTGESHDTGIATNTLSEKDRLQIQQDNAIAKQNDAQDFKASNTTTQPTQQRHALDNKIIELINRNPDWAKYIDKESGIVGPVGTGGSSWTGNPGLTQEVRTQILDALHGPSAAAPITTPAPATPAVVPPPAVNQLPTPDKRVVGQVYTLGNGTKATWNGKSFNPVQ